jgi:hypothetical protein
MSAHTKRFALHAVLLTTGVVLIMLRILPLSALGLGLFLFSLSYSSYRSRATPSAWWLAPLILLVGLAVVWGLPTGTAFTRQTMHSWYFIVFPGFWLVDLLAEFRQWRKLKRRADGS